MTLDQYFPVPKKSEPTTAVEVRCSNPHCRKVLTDKDIVFRYGKKGEEQVYCMACYKAKLKPREDSEEPL